jgi:hypothetical protein
MQSRGITKIGIGARLSRLRRAALRFDNPVAAKSIYLAECLQAQVDQSFRLGAVD